MGRPKRRQNPEEVSFKHQKKGLFKKIHELQTLCNIEACMVIYPPPPLATSAPETWPEDPNEFRRIAQRYQDRKNQTARPIVSDNGPKRGGGGGGAAAAVAHSRNPGFHLRDFADQLGRLDSSQLLQLSAVLEKKIGEADQRMQWIKDVRRNLHCDDDRDVHQTSTDSLTPANHREFLPRDTFVGGGNANKEFWTRVRTPWEK